MNEIEMKILIKKAQKGDQESFRELVNKFHSLIKSVSRKYYAPGCTQDDLLQELYIAFWQAVQNYYPEKGMSFKNYALLCMKARIATFLKWSRRQKYALLNEAVSLDEVILQGTTNHERIITRLDKLIPNTPTLEEEIINREREYEWEKFWHEFKEKNLTELERIILKEYLKNKSYKEIAVIVNRNKKAVDNAMVRIKFKLKNKLPREFQEEILEKTS